MTTPKSCSTAFTGDSARTQKNGGYGIGLSVAQAIAELHKGSITAETYLQPPQNPAPTPQINKTPICLCSRLKYKTTVCRRLNQVSHLQTVLILKRPMYPLPSMIFSSLNNTDLPFSVEFLHLDNGRKFDKQFSLPSYRCSFLFQPNASSNDCFQ